MMVLYKDPGRKSRKEVLVILTAYSGSVFIAALLEQLFFMTSL